MANAWSNPHQRDYVLVPFAPDDPIPAGQWQNPDTNAPIQNCFCPICSRTRDANHDMTEGTKCTIIYQDPSPPVECVDSYANQNIGGADPAGIGATGSYPTLVWPVAPQASHQENTGYAPLHQVVDPPQVQMGTVPNEGAPVLSIPERLRRLARSYVDNPDSIVNGVHLEPGPSGRFQVVITIDIGDVLGDTTN